MAIVQPRNVSALQSFLGGFEASANRAQANREEARSIQLEKLDLDLKMAQNGLKVITGPNGELSFAKQAPGENIVQQAQMEQAAALNPNFNMVPNGTGGFRLADDPQSLRNQSAAIKNKTAQLQNTLMEIQTNFEKETNPVKKSAMMNKGLLLENEVNNLKGNQKMVTERHDVQIANERLKGEALTRTFQEDDFLRDFTEKLRSPEGIASLIEDNPRGTLFMLMKSGMSFGDAQAMVDGTAERMSQARVEMAEAQVELAQKEVKETKDDRPVTLSQLQATDVRKTQILIMAKAEFDKRGFDMNDISDEGDLDELIGKGDHTFGNLFGASDEIDKDKLEGIIESIAISSNFTKAEVAKELFSDMSSDIDAAIRKIESVSTGERIVKASSNPIGALLEGKKLSAAKRTVLKLKAIKDTLEKISKETESEK